MNKKSRTIYAASSTGSKYIDCHQTTGSTPLIVSFKSGHFGRADIRKKQISFFRLVLRRKAMENIGRLERSTVEVDVGWFKAVAWRNILRRIDTEHQEIYGEPRTLMPIR